MIALAYSEASRSLLLQEVFASQIKFALLLLT